MAQPRVDTIYESRIHPGVRIGMQRSVPDTEILLKHIMAFNPSLIIELGHGAGGFTMAMHEAVPKAYIKSFDIRKLPLDEVIDNVSGRVSFINDDVLAGSAVVRRYLSWDNKKFLYCDNGNKTLEVLMYAPLLKPGDMLGVHDYSIQPLIHVGLTSCGVEDFLAKLGFVQHHHDEFMEGEYRSRLWILPKTK